jgi:hypothetical protein
MVQQNPRLELFEAANSAPLAAISRARTVVNEPNSLGKASQATK